MKFLIVAPSYRHKVGIHYEIPLGLLYISSSLKSKGYQVDCLNLNERESVQIALEKEIVEKNIDIICTGGLSFHFTEVRAILDIARNTKPDIITIIGGGLVSSEPRLMMETLKPAFGVVGEGEETIVELADAIINSKDFSKIDGIMYYDKDKREIIENKPRRAIEDIDSIPYPDYDGFEVSRYLDMQMPSDDVFLYPYDKPRALPIISSRGCPYSCTFCYSPLGKNYRHRALDDVFKEVEYLIEKYNINMLMVVDELIDVDPERVKEFCRRIKPYNLKWIAQMRVDRVTEEIIDMLKDSGCTTISYGLESASDVILKSMKKHINLSQIENALELTYRAKVGIQGNFILGDQAETWETANQTLQWWLNNRKYLINLSLVRAYPGTELYYKAIEKGLIKDKINFIEAGCPFLNWTELSNEERVDYSRLKQYYWIKYDRFPVRMLSCKKEGVAPYKGPFYAIKVKCPHCHKIIEYKNMHKMGLAMSMTFCGCRVACRECNQRFDLLHFDPFKLRLKNFIYTSIFPLSYNTKFSFIYRVLAFIYNRRAIWRETVSTRDPGRARRKKE